MTCKRCDELASEVSGLRKALEDYGGLHTDKDGVLRKHPALRRLPHDHVAAMERRLKAKWEKEVNLKYLQECKKFGLNCLQDQYENAYVEATIHKQVVDKCSKYEKAMRDDIEGAGPCTGPLYHRCIRAALGIAPEGSGPDVVRAAALESEGE